jgi:hypothetical protein
VPADRASARSAGGPVPAPAVPSVGGAGRVRGGRVRAVAYGWGSVAAGTGAAVGVDALAGGLDGRPAVFLLVVFLVPFWDRLPARVSARIGVLAGVTAAIAAGWYALAALHAAAWWPAAAFGLACALAGTAAAFVPRPRTVER